MAFVSCLAHSAWVKFLTRLLEAQGQIRLCLGLIMELVAFILAVCRTGSCCRRAKADKPHARNTVPTVYYQYCVYHELISIASVPKAYGDSSIHIQLPHVYTHSRGSTVLCQKSGKPTTHSHTRFGLLLRGGESAALAVVPMLQRQGTCPHRQVPAATHCAPAQLAAARESTHITS